MRIVHLAQFYPPVIGGEERHVVTLTQALADRGHQVTVISLPHPEREDVVMNGNVEVISVRGLASRFSGLFSETERPHAPPFPDPGLSLRLNEIVSKIKPDVVHGHNWLARSYLPVKPRHKAGLVVTLHDYSLPCARKNLLYEGEPCSGPAPAKCLSCASEHFGSLLGPVTCLGNWSTSRLEKHMVDRYITVSKAVARKSGLEAAGRPYSVLPTFISDNIGVLPPVQDDRLHDLPEAGYLLFVGDLTRAKGIHVLLKAYSKLANPPPLVLIGRRCADTPVELPSNAMLFESWPHAAVMHAWSRCLFGIAPSVWAEACGTIVMEANAVGKAMIASDTGGLSDLVDAPRTGLLVPPGDAEALASAMQTLITNVGMREMMEVQARSHVERFMAKTILPEIEGVYRDVAPKSGELAWKMSSSSYLPRG